MTTTQYPECEKMKAIQKESQTIGEFLEWLSGKGIHLVTVHTHTDACLDEEGESKDEFGNRLCGYSEGAYQPLHTSTENLLADYYNINLDKVDAEKDQMLKELRKN
jgi:hypothetical protein